jgi:hypothetical protein
MLTLIRGDAGAGLIGDDRIENAANMLGPNVDNCGWQFGSSHILEKPNHHQAPRPRLVLALCA